MTNNRAIDYRGILSDIRAKQNEQEKAIAAFEAAIKKLEQLGLLSTAPSRKSENGSLPANISVIDPRIVDLRGKSSYEAAAGLLKIKGISMHTNEVYSQLKAHGVLSPATKQVTMASALYRAVKGKNSVVQQAGKGMWKYKAISGDDSL
jgi:hypothetical protein